MAEPLELRLTEWRRPFQGVQTLFALVFGGLLVGCVVVLGAVKWLAIESQVIVRTLFGVSVFATVALPLWADHRKRPGATLRLDGGRLGYAEDGGRRVDLPISDLLFVYASKEVCSIHLRGTKPIAVQRSRVTMPLGELERRVLEHLAAFGPSQLTTRDIAAYNDRGMKAFRRTIVARIFVGVALALGFLALMCAVVPRSPH